MYVSIECLHPVNVQAAATGPPQIASTEQHEEQIEKTKQEVHTADTVPFDEI